MSIPQVTVIITTYGRPDQITKAIDSAFNQTESDWQLVICDDNGIGTENQLITEKLVKKIIDPRVEYVASEKNIGQAAQLNIGISHAKAPYVAFLDDDDQYRPAKLEKQLDYIKGTEFDAVYCNYRRVKKGETYHVSALSRGVNEGNLFLDIMLGVSELCSSAFMVKTDVIKKIGGFDDRFRRHVDWIMYIRFFKSHTVGIVEDVLLDMYMADDNSLPSPELIYTVKKKMFDLYKDEFALLGPKTLKQVYWVHWITLYRVALTSRKYGIALKALYKSITDGKINLARLVRATASGIKHSRTFGRQSR